MRPEIDWTVIAAVVVGVLGSARLTRLIVGDKFPLSVRLRIWWDNHVPEETSLWNPLLHCPWCLAPWVTLVTIGLAIVTDLHWGWWLFYGWLAASYVASWVVFHDED
jgi:hypothetical protein